MIILVIINDDNRGFCLSCLDFCRHKETSVSGRNPAVLLSYAAGSLIVITGQLAERTTRSAVLPKMR
jgi:hypothetical protein